MATQFPGQVKRRIRRQQAQALNSGDTLLVQMGAEEFLDYAIKTQMQQGMTQQQALDWVGRTLEQSSVVSDS